MSDTAVFNRENLEKLALSVINALSNLQASCRPNPSDKVQPMIETELQKHLYEFVLGWLVNDGYDARVGNAEVTASVISWALFGTAMQYNQDFPTQTVEVLAERSVAILFDGVLAA